MRTIHRDIAAALVISRDNKLLFGKKDHSGGGVYIDCWHTPGGGIEEDETRLETLAREMKEEVGLDIAQATVALLDDKGEGESSKQLKGTGEVVKVKMRFYVYKIEIDKDAQDIDVKPGDDLKELKWVDRADLNKIKLTPPSIELFMRLDWANFNVTG